MTHHPVDVVAGHVERVVVADLDEEWGKQSVSLVEQAGSEGTLVVGDIATAEGARQAVDHAIDRFGGLDILVNNAGIAQQTPEDTWNCSEEVWDRVIRINLKSVYLCSKFAIPPMLEQAAGSVVNIASKPPSPPRRGATASSQARTAGSRATSHRSHEGPCR